MRKSKQKKASPFLTKSKKACFSKKQACKLKDFLLATIISKFARF